MQVNPSQLFKILELNNSLTLAGVFAMFRDTRAKVGYEIKDDTDEQTTYKVFIDLRSYNNVGCLTIVHDKVKQTSVLRNKGLASHTLNWEALKKEP